MSRGTSVSAHKTYGTHFQTSDRCVACHNGITTPSGEDVSVVLETERGTTTIQGETQISTFSAIGTDTGAFPILQQAKIQWSRKLGRGASAGAWVPDCPRQSSRGRMLW